MPRTRTLLALVLLPLLVFLVACSSGGDDDGDDSSGGNQPSTSDSSSSGSTGGTSGGSTGDSSNSGGSSGGSGSTDAQILSNCPELIGMFGAFTGGAFTNPGATNAGDGLATAGQVFQNAADNAPSEIKADMQVLADAFSAYNDALQDLGIDFSNPASFATLDPAKLAQLEDVFSTFDTAEVEQASDNLDAWFTANCE